MICKNCNANIADDALYCPECFERHAPKAQAEKVAQIKQKQKLLIGNLFKSKVFMAYTIGMAFVLLSHILGLGFSVGDVIGSDGGLAVIPLLIILGFVVPPIMGLVACLKLLFHKEGSFHPGLMRGLKTVPKFWRIVFAIVRILLTILLVLLIALVLIVVLAFSSEEGDSSSFMMAIHTLSTQGGGDEGGLFGIVETLENTFQVAGGILALILIAIFVASFLFLSYCTKTYNKIDAYFEKLATSYMTDEFTESQDLPTISLYVMAGIFVFMGGGTFSLDAMVGPGMLYIANAIYLILTAIFFQYSEKMQSDNIMMYQVENKKLVEINAKVSAEINEIKRKQRLEAYQREQEEKAQMAAIAQQEVKAQQDATRAQQDMMQQMMMALLQQNMAQMANGKMNPNQMPVMPNNVAMPTAPADNTAAKEAAPTESQEK